MVCGEMRQGWERAFPNGGREACEQRHQGRSVAWAVGSESHGGEEGWTVRLWLDQVGNGEPPELFEKGCGVCQVVNHERRSVQDELWGEEGSHQERRSVAVRPGSGQSCGVSLKDSVPERCPAPD